MSYETESEREIREAYLFLRKNNHSISDQCLDFMLHHSLEALKDETCGSCKHYDTSGFCTDSGIEYFESDDFCSRWKQN